MKSDKKYFVSVAGNIGSGKSTLTKLIAERFNWTPYYESVADNPYLEDFYTDMKRWSFNLQIYFLSHRFRVHKEITEIKNSVIQDRSIYEDVEIFAKNLFELKRMDFRDYENYKTLFREMTAYLTAPDLLIYLKADVTTLVKQIKLRGREFEKNIEISYLDKLNNTYDEWMQNYKYGNSITIETDELDFVQSEKDFEYITGLINKELD